ncbi:16944_t:CDS:1, partial [Racocetra persica]
MSHPLILLELLENIFSFLAKDKALYPALFVNRLWYHCSAPILWRHIEFSIEGYQQNRYSKDT